MIQFTRRWAKDVLAVLKKVFRGPNSALPPVLLRAGPEGLVVRVQARGFSVQYQDSEPRESCELVVPARAFEDTAGAKAEPASFYYRRDGVFGASWEERGLTRQLEYPAATRSEEPFPTPPERLAANPARLRQALADACDVTDVTSSRYALGCLQLRGERGDLCATDGRQLLMQRGFAWGFEDTVLLPATKLFAAKELECESDILIGRTEKHLYLRFGPWSFWLPLELEARFPIVDNILPPAGNAKTVLELSSADARFLIDNLHRLPGSTFERKVTLDLNGSVAIRARTDDTPQGVEMILRASTKSGSDVRIGIDRRYLARAAGMGFDRIYLSDPATAMLAEDATRSYLWMPLDDSHLLGPSADFIRLESPLVGPTTERRSSLTPQHNHPMPTTSKSPPATPIAKKPATRLPQTAGGASLDQALQVRDALRAQLAAVKELIRTLRSERQGRRRLKSTLASLKNLQQVA